MATLIKPNGTEEILTPANHAEGFGLKELYGILGCDMIETIGLRDGRIMIIDEEGKFKPIVRNPRATALLHEAGGMLDDFITGTALICDDKEFQ